MEINCSEILYDQASNISREPFQMDTVHDLAATIEDEGLIHPVVVRPIEHPKYKYKLFIGFRRFAAVSIVLGWETIRAEIVECDENEANLRNALENIQRQSISFWEECKAVHAAFPDRSTQTTVIGRKFGKTRGWVRPRWYLWDMPEEVIEQVRDGLLNQGEMQLIIQHKTPEDQVAAAETIRQAQSEGIPTRTIQSKLSARKAYRSQKELQRMMTVLMDEGLEREMHVLRYAAGDISDEQLFRYLGCEITSQGSDICDNDGGEDS